MTKRLLLFVMAVSAVFTMLFYSASTPVAHSQGEMEVQCGQIVEAEFTGNMQEHIYLLNMAPRESFDVSVEPFGDFLSTVIATYGPTGVRIGISERQDGAGMIYLKKSPSITSGILSARGQYKIRIANTPLRYDNLYNDQRYYGGVGLYKLLIGCTTSDGTKIEPGDIPQPTPTPAPLPAPVKQTSSQTSLAQQPTSETLFSFLETGQMYEITFGLQTETIKLIELRSDGWAKVEVDNKTGWLNINQVALIMPIN